MEPPGPDVRAEPGPQAEPPLGPVRLSAALAAIALAASSTGNLALLGAALAVLAAGPLAALGAVLALAAVLVRWASPSLSALAGAQAVLGPAGNVGSAAAGASAWCAAVALALAVPAPGASWRSPARALVVAAFGLSAGLVVAGPSVVQRPATRVLGAVVGLLLAGALAEQVSPRLRAPFAAAVGAAALALAVAAA